MYIPICLSLANRERNYIHMHTRTLWRETEDLTKKACAPCCCLSSWHKLCAAPITSLNSCRHICRMMVSQKQLGAFRGWKQCGVANAVGLCKLCVCVCMCLHMYMHMYIYIRIRIGTGTCICMCACTCTCLCICLYICPCICTCICICKCSYKCKCKSKFTCKCKM